MKAFVVRTVAGLALLLFGAGAFLSWSEQTSPLDVRVDKVIVLKAQRRLLLMYDGEVLKSFRVSLGREPSGRKTQQGDGRTPEGVYRIDYRNAPSAFHLSLHISYPNAEDRAAAAHQGVSPGGEIMIHGLPNRVLGFLSFLTKFPGVASLSQLHRFFDWTEGCIAVTDEEIEEIWRTVPDGPPIEIRA